MIANNVLLTTEINGFELRQFYYSPQVLLPPNNTLLHSLYGFITYKPEWDEIVYTGNASPTITVHDAAIFASSNVVSVLNAPTLNDFRINQEVIGDTLPSDTRIKYINEDNFTLTLTKNSTANYIGKLKFKGFVDNDDKITLYDPSNKLQPIDYTKCAVKIDVTNIPGELIYYKHIKGFDAQTKTLLVDSVFDDAPYIDEKSTVQIVYDDTHPPPPKNTVKYKKDIYKNIIFLKKLVPNDISPVIKRVNWTSDAVYDYYRDDLDMFELKEDGSKKYNFYIMNQFYQVFKCLWNGNGRPSTVEPYFVAGNFDDIENIFYDPDDGYKWKYMFTIPQGKLQKFMDDTWMPLPTNDLPDVTASSEKQGGIEAINVTNTGSGYNLSNAIVNIVITGDGYGASAYAEVDSKTEKLENIVVKSPGYGYSTANVSIVSSSGSGAKAVASISPIAGNGSDIISELGCDNLMVTCMFVGTENGKMPADIKIRQFGLLVNPDASSVYPRSIANGESYSTTTDIVVSSGFGSFVDGELIYQTPNNANIANAVFVSTCVKYEPAGNRLRLTNTRGTIFTGRPVYGYSSGTSRTLLQSINSDFINYSGNIIYVENRESIQRSLDGLELFRVVLKF
jgi:hypothetical protein